MNTNNDLSGVTVTDLFIDTWRSNRRHDNRKRVRDLIGNLALVAEQDPEGTTFIYRGESECHDKVSSGLYRQFHELDEEIFDITEAQKRQLTMARAYAKDEDDDAKILAQIQHRGGKTNLIDFTSDLNVALFFACNYSPDKDGRVIFFKRQQWDDYSDYSIQPATQPSNMADAQKSLFVISNKGYIRNEDITVYEIPSELKRDILQHLFTVYGIEPSTIYNDISGYIRDQNHFPDLEADFRAGQESFTTGDWDKAIDFYTRCLDNSSLEDDHGIIHYLYHQRGIAYFKVGNKRDSLRDLEISYRGHWKRKPELPEQIRNWFDKAKWKKTEPPREPQSPQREKGHRLWVEAQDPDGKFVDGASLKFLSEDGYEDSAKIQNGRLHVKIPNECHGSRCLFWFNMDGYRGVNPVQVLLRDSFTATLKPEERNSGATEVKIKVTYDMTEVT